jgi:NAD+ synthase
MKKLANEIVAWLKDYAEKNGRKSFVVGVSGGVDSALVSTLCAKTGLTTYAAILPCQSKEIETARGTQHVCWLQSNFTNVVHCKVDLTAAFEAFYDETKYDFADQLGYANAKSRLRMIALYQIATPNDGLVVGTGNKVEDFGVGFFTKYGDGGVDISPIADLLKSEVRQMCRELGVLPELAEAVPTDGLWPDARTDEGQLGATYDELEWAMKFTEEKFDPNARLTARQQEVLNAYMKRHISSRHKMDPIPTFKRSK